MSSMRILYVIMVFAFFALSPASAQYNIPKDQSTVRILGYFMVGRDDIPEANVTIEQFKAHLTILKEGNFNVISLDEIAKAYENEIALPDKSVAITFDGGDKSILTNAVPLLEKYQFPYTIFIATDRADENNPAYINWKELKKLQKTGLATIGLHGQAYASFNFDTLKNIEKYINNATARLRNQIPDNNRFFAFPFGENNALYLEIIKRYNFNGIYGQQSGVAYKDIPQDVLPRFMMTEDYADPDRFNMVINSEAITTTDITPATSMINSQNPAIGFTVTDDLTHELHKLSCFTSGQDSPAMDIIGNRVELRLASEPDMDRLRVNCTLPVTQKNVEKTISWRWLGFLFHIHEPVLAQ